MTEGSADAPLPAHPEVSGKELDTIPVTPHTIRALRNTIRGLGTGEFSLGDKTFSLLAFNPKLYITGGNANLTVIEPNDVRTYYSIDVGNYSSGHAEPLEYFKIKKDTSDPLDGSEDPEPPIEDPEDKLRRILGRIDAKNEEREALRDLTGLPDISEGEVRRLITDLSSDELRKI